MLGSYINTDANINYLLTKIYNKYDVHNDQSKLEVLEIVQKYVNDTKEFYDLMGDLDSIPDKLNTLETDFSTQLSNFVQKVSNIQVTDQTLITDDNEILKQDVITGIDELYKGSLMT